MKFKAFGVVGVGAGMLLAAPLILLLGNSPGPCAPSLGSGSIGSEQVPTNVEHWAAEAAQQTRADEKLLLAMSYAETHWGQAANGVPEGTATTWMDGLDRDVDRRALAPGGLVSEGLGRHQGIALGDWINSTPVGSRGEHALGFAQFLPSTWRTVAQAHPKPNAGTWDPYNPLDALTLAGWYFRDILPSVGGDVPRAFDAYGTGAAGWQAYQALSSTWKGAPVAASCRLGEIQSGNWITTPDVLADIRIGNAQGVRVPPSRLFTWVPDGAFPAGGFPHDSYPGGRMPPDQCTTWASYNVLVPDAHLGDAGNWPQALARYGWQLPAKDAPSGGSLAIWGVGLGGTGHVGVVIAFTPDHAQVLVSEMNWLAPGLVDQRVIQPQRESHFLGFMPVPGGGATS